VVGQDIKNGGHVILGHGPLSIFSITLIDELNLDEEFLFSIKFYGPRFYHLSPHKATTTRMGACLHSRKKHCETY